MHIHRSKQIQMKRWIQESVLQPLISAVAPGAFDMRKEVDTDVYQRQLSLPVFIRLRLISKAPVVALGSWSVTLSPNAAGGVLYLASWFLFSSILPLPGQISFKACWNSHEKLLSGLFAMPRCDGVHWFPPVSSSLCHLLTASCWVTKLLHPREQQPHIYILIKFVNHACRCPKGCHLCLFLCS